MDGRARLVVFAGLPGVGKSTLARPVAERLDAIWLRIDTVEAAVLRAGIPRSFETGLAAYLVARDLAREHLDLGRNVVIDAVNGVEPARELWRDLANATNAERFVIEVVCRDARVLRARVEGRAPPTPPLPALRWDEVVAREYVAWQEPVLTVEGNRPVEENVEKILRYCSDGLAYE